jgi:hypothetical protein
MALPNVPNDLRAFLQSGGALSCDEAQCTAKAIELQSLDKLVALVLTVRIKADSDLGAEDPHAGELGYYRVSAVSLVRSCRNYRPAGLLVWLPEQEVYGTWDDDHHVLWVFPGAIWPQIAANPLPYLNALWSRQTRQVVGAQQLRWWECCEFEER